MKSAGKAFTLAEVLGVVVIIGILLILIVPTILNRLTSSKNVAHNAGENIVFDAASQHISENPEDYPPGKAGRYCISIRTLVDEGKLVNPVKDPSTGDDISDKSVMVTVYSAGTSDYEIREGDDCDRLSSLPMIDFEVTPKGSSWVPKRTVKIIWPAIDGDYKARYRVDNGEWQYVDSINSRSGGSTEIIFDKSATSRPLQAQYIGVGEETSTNNIIDSKINIVNVDSVKPTCTLSLAGTMGDNNWYRSNVTVNFGENNSNLNDDLSGVVSYNLSKSDTTSFDGVSSLVQTEDTAGAKYYGYVKDKAGNIGQCSTEIKKDATKPTLTYTLRKINNGVDEGPAYSNQWSQRQIQRSFFPADNLSGVAKMQYKTTGTNTWYDEGNVSSWMMNEGRNDASFRVIDQAGNISDETRLILLVDWTPPTINFGISGYFTATVSCSDGNSQVNGSTYWTVGLSGTWNNTVGATCRDYAGNVASASHVYPYSSCRYTVNTCQGGYDSVWSSSAGCGYKCPYTTTETKTTCIKMNVTNCRKNFPNATHSNGMCCGPITQTVTKYRYCCTGGYVSRWNSCKYGTPNACRGGFSF